MRYVIGLPICLVLVSGAIWLASNRSFQVTAQNGESASDPAPGTPGRHTPAVADAEFTEDTKAAFDALAVNGCMLLPIQEHNIASQIDGQLTEILVSLGEHIDKGHCLAQLDDQTLRLQIELLQIKASSTSNEKIALAQFDEADAKVKYAMKANLPGLIAVPELELKTYLAQRDRYACEMKKAVEDRDEAIKELDKAKVQLRRHKIESALQGEVVKIFKKPGETVKQGESLFRLARIDRLRIEGFCKVQNAGLLHPGQAVLVEPETQGSQAAQLIGHTAAVNDLAMSQDGKLLASASDDGTVCVWSWPGGAHLATLQHPGPVHAVDLHQLNKDSPRQYLLATGGEDRVVRVWRFFATGKIQSPVEFPGHEGVVTAVAFSPDGKLCASGGEDRKIGLWDLANGNNAGWICDEGAYKKSAHQGAITGIQFVDQDILVSTGSDNLHKVWNIQGGRIQLTKKHAGRMGDVGRFGIRGQHVLLDHGSELRILDRDGGTVQGVLHNTKHVRFERFACLSPSQQTILTTSGNVIQLWRTPADPKTRALLYKTFEQDPRALPDLGGFEICQYQLPKAAQARCGVFTPDETIAFTAGTGHMIQAWAIPPKTEWKPREARLTYVGSEVEPGTELVRIQAELDNPADTARRWLPGTFVNLKFFP